MSDQHIRQATIKDASKITNLLAQLDYPMEEELVIIKLSAMLKTNDSEIFVYEQESVVTGCLSMHFIPQLGLQGDVAIITYLAIDLSSRSKGIGTLLENMATQLAINKGCDRIQLHCNLRRERAHQFYEKQGYSESRKYFTKSLKQVNDCDTIS